MNADEDPVWRGRGDTEAARLELRFTPALEDEFERFTARARRRTFQRIGQLQLVMTHVGAVGLYALLDDLQLVVLATLAIDVFSLGCYLILRRKPPPIVRETVMMCGVLAWVLMAETLSLVGATQYLWIIQTAIAVQPFLMAAAIQLRLPYCIVGCVATVLCVVAGNAVFSQAVPSAQLWMALVQFVAAVYALFGCWKLEYAERLNFLSIRESERNARELDRANGHLAHLIRFDDLTGVRNRRGLREAFDADFARRDGVGVLVLDVDYFKRFNDYYGHLAGDHCLGTLAETLSNAVHSARGIVARWGGEEFIAVVRARDAGEVAAWAERLRRGVRDLDIAHARSPLGGCVTLTAGYVFVESGGTADLDALIDAADRALYAAKEAGRDRARGARSPVGEAAGRPTAFANAAARPD